MKEKGLGRFTDMRDPKPFARPVFSLRHPKTLKYRIRQEAILRERLQQFSDLPVEGLGDCRIRAITNLEKSFRENRPRALIQMATVIGKTFTAEKDHRKELLTSISSYVMIYDNATVTN